METQAKKTFNKRAFISVAMFVSLLGLPISGIMNHNLQFEDFSAERHFWMAAHNISAILFTILALSHIILNYRVLIKYIKKAKEATMSREAIFAIGLVVIIVALFSSHAFHMR